jgi:hypothetical protein
MTIKRYNSEKDNTIVNALKENLSSRGSKGNMGASDILEVFSIFGQASTSSLEQARILVQFPVGTISSDRDSGILPSSGSVTFKFKMSNTPHGQTTPKNYTLVTHPIVRDWTEGDGLDMESYLDIEASNWVSASDGTPWHTTGSDYATASYINNSTVPVEYSQVFEDGIENLEIDITGLTEEWIKYHKGNATASSASINFLQNPSGSGQVISIYSHEGEEYTYTFITSSTYSIGNNVYLELSGTAAETAGALQNRIDSDFGGTITTDRSSGLLALTQSVSGFHGNTIISSSIAVATASISGFAGGTGMPNYGMILKLRDDFEDGSKERSYYTKKFYSRTSHEFFLKPQIEVQWDGSIKDDRNYVLKSSSLAPASDNLNSVYHYNRFRGSLVDIPNTGSDVIVKFYPTLGGDPASIVQSGGLVDTVVTASRADTGIYKATFAYSGSSTTLYDVWMKTDSGTETVLVTGSGFTVHADNVEDAYAIPSYVVNVTNLKASYLQTEKATFRVYTRNKNWSPNIYTVASQTAPVNTIKQMYYKITKVSDNYEVISYSTGSTPSYSELSYDKDGSYFDLDMGLLEENNAYQINFVFKDGPNYIELPEKFRFRVDP